VANSKQLDFGIKETVICTQSKLLKDKSSMNDFKQERIGCVLHS